jgi:hypothetical protein
MEYFAKLHEKFPKVVEFLQNPVNFFADSEIVCIFAKT